MHQDSIFIFFQWIMPYTQLLFTIILWVVIILRLKSIEQSNAQFPSRWGTMNKILIIASGLLCTGYVFLLVSARVLVVITWNMASSKNLPEELLTPDSFTVDEAVEMMDLYNAQDPILLASRTALFFALWLSKFAFLSFFMRNRNYLQGLHKLVPLTVMIITALMFIVGIWAAFRDVGSDITPVEDLVPDKRWEGEKYSLFSIYVEYLLASLSIVQDFLVTAMGCYLIRSIPRPSGGVILLVGMQSLTITIGLVRIVCFRLEVEKEYSTPESENDNIIPYGGNLDLAFIFLSDFEAIFSVIVSCIPGVRAWYRGTAWKRRKQVALERTAGTLQLAKDTDNGRFNTDDLESSGQKLEILEEEKVAT